MPIPPNDRFTKALQPASSQQEWRSTFPKDGDPQDAALAQFLAEKKKSLTPTESVIDVGCGKAILAFALLYVFGERPAPRYIAIDKADILDAVAIPNAIHNNSEKFSYETFTAPGQQLSDVKLVVVRNVLHELDIAECADLFVAISNRIKPGTELFIQDMENLPEIEPRFAGWDSALLTDVLSALGFEPKEFALKSHSGNLWFAINCVTPLPISRENAIQLLKDARRRQASNMEKRLRHLKNNWNNEHRSEFQVLAVEHSSLLVQLGTLDDSTEMAASISGLGLIVPLRSAAAKLGVSFEKAEDKPVEQSGVLGVIFNKDSIDIPSMLRAASSTIWFWGYSLAPMFRYEQNVMALKDAADRGVSVKLLLTDPDSLAAQSRAEQPIYASEHVLRTEIMSTIEDAREFRAQLGEKGPQFELRLCNQIPPCSAFGTDDVAVFSVYSPGLRGGVTPCFVIAEASVADLSYYTILKSDFDLAFKLGKAT